MEEALKNFLAAQERMLNRWAESSPDVQNELWRDLHYSADAVRELLTTPVA